MSDFYQNGVVTVLHRLENSNIDQLKQELSRYGRIHPIALVLPSLYAELSRPALKHIVDTLTGVSYLSEIVISLDRASALEFRLAKQYFSLLPQRVRLIWNDWTRIQSILNLLVGKNLDIGLPGKGRGCWMAFGYVLARNQSQVIALHDCDIMSYNGEYVAALSYPIANPNLGYEFCKGYNNSLTFDRHEERTAVEAFLKAITLATEGFLDDPLGVPMISNWSRVAHAIPDIFERMAEAVEADHAMSLNQTPLTPATDACLRDIGPAASPVSISSSGHADTACHVVRAAFAARAKYFPEPRTVLVNSDDGSSDDTQGPTSAEAELTTEQLCQTFDQRKPYLPARLDGLERGSAVYSARSRTCTSTGGVHERFD